MSEEEELTVMFTANTLLTLLKTRPFVPFRLVLSEGGMVEVPGPKYVLPGRGFAVVGFPDPADADALIDRWTTIWYMHVTRVEHIHPGAPPFTTPAGPADSSTPSFV
jgi:hypothetical protein